ncbi:MAG TPA: hypothetical protein VEY32_08770 [Flavisolibacter sp.]|nr:hypothetical protein [Flavisolibacter sp.]
MGHITKKTAYFDIDINSDSKNILIIQKWKYEWLANGFSSWTHEERQKMHKSFERVIDGTWSNNAKVKISGNSKYAELYQKETFSVTFDVQWITGTPFHFKVEVRKVAPKDYSNIPNVQWSRNLIQLYSIDTTALAKVGAPAGIKQKNVAHEFGHAIGNTSGIRGMHADEYKTSSPYFEEKSSIMNVGMQLKKRHFDYLQTELNTMIPNTRFTITL